MAKRDLDDDDALRSTERERPARPGDDRSSPGADGATVERAPARAQLEADEPARIDRFEIRRTVGAGGMGVVYSAYDPQLHRDVALKVIKRLGAGDAHARERLQAEARALARLKHPNVVSVYELVPVDDQLVMVMELVEGVTLAAWAVVAPRTWREIVEVYVAAGHGLVAAHELGMVHRDFKPSNVMVGRDGRVCVLDFGLARIAAIANDPAAPPVEAGKRDAVVSADPPAATAVVPLSPNTLTAPGAVVGTPGYMAPEQMCGKPASPASDQFSFCVALHHSVFGVRPFAGDEIESLLPAIVAGQIAPPPPTHRVPARVRALVLRGLAAEPVARHASMKSLLAALERERGRRRWWPALAVAAGIAIVIAAAAIVIAQPTATAGAACDDGTDEIAAISSLPRGVATRARLLAVGAPPDEADRVVRRLDDYGRRWGEARLTACRSHRAHRMTEVQYRRSADCLARRRDSLASLADNLAHLDRGRGVNALALADALAPLTACTDVAALDVAPDPPATEEAAVEVGAVRSLVREAEDLNATGRSDEALALASDALVRAERAGYAPAVVEAALLAGRLRLFRREWTEATEVLRRAQELALASRPPMTALAVEAAARRVFVGSRRRDDLETLVAVVEHDEPMSRGLPGDHFARPLLLCNVGVAYKVLGFRAEAARYLELARAELEGVVQPNIELTAIDLNRAMLTADPTSRVDLARNVWELRRDRLGAGHLMTLEALWMYGHFVLDPATALPLIDKLCELYATHHREQVNTRIGAEYSRAFLTAERGDDDDAARRYADVATLARGATSDEARGKGALAAGYASLAGGDPASALARFTTVIDTFTAKENAVDRLPAADGQLGAGLAERALGRGREAIRHLEIAERAFAEAVTQDESVRHRQRLASTRIALAAALRAVGDRGPRPAELEARAAEFYRSAGSTTYRRRLERLPR